MWRGEIINSVIDAIDAQSYLEIGLSMPDRNYFWVNCKYKECVDPYDKNPGETTDFESESVRDYVREHILTYQMTSDALFETLPYDKKYDVIFIDGWHSEEQLGRDVINGFKHLNKGGVIIAHDCLPELEEYQYLTDDPMAVWNGDVWKALPMLGEQGINYKVVDTDFGCGIFTFDGDAENLVYPPMADYTYNQVFSSKVVRNNVMHVISESEFNHYLQELRNRRFTL